MILPIKFYGENVLRKISEPVTEFDDNLVQFVNNMTETMSSAPGIGLAAPQVGVNKRIIIVDISHENHKDKLYQLINPEILELSKETDRLEEGCLSIPGINEAVVRPIRAKIRARNLKGEEILMESEGLLARCFQHEIDHLNGTLFVDRLVPFRKRLLRNKLKKLFGKISPPLHPMASLLNAGVE